MTNFTENDDINSQHFPFRTFSRTLKFYVFVQLLVKSKFLQCWVLN